MAPTMRAKMKVVSVEDKREFGCEGLSFSAVCKNDGYSEDGSDENNTYAKWTPQADLQMTVSNPALFGKFNVGDEFYLDFTKAS